CQSVARMERSDIRGEQSRPPDVKARRRAAWYRFRALAKRGEYAGHYRTAEIDSRGRRCGCGATGGARAEAGNPSGRLAQLRIARIRPTPPDRPPAGFEPNRLR